VSEKSSKDIFDEKPDRVEKTRVLIDLDGVVRDFVGSLTRVYKFHFPEHEVLPVISRRLEDFFPIGDQIYKFVKSDQIEKIMVEADPYPGALGALEKWKDKFEIVVVTSQPDFSRASTYLWIGKHNIPTNEVHVTHYKSEIDGYALLDDFVDNLDEFHATGRLAVCFDQPWNRDWKGPRVKTVDQFFDFVQDSQIEKLSKQSNS
jgi:uncharacterized HAD superfamily protein